MIQVVHPGIYNSIQDKGRVGYSKFGLPQSGYMDVYAASIGNALLNNPRNTTVIEVTFGQGKFRFTNDAVIALTGGDFCPKVNGIHVKMKTVIKVCDGDVLSFGKRKFGARVYMAVKGGIKRATILNSMSSTKGINEVKLSKGDEIQIGKTDIDLDQPTARLKIQQEHFECSIIDCYPGPEYDLLSEEHKRKLAQEFSISEDNNRVGYRLNEKIKNELKPIITSGVLPGTVQLTPSGQLIVLMKDCQVTGGYPRVLQLSDYAVSKLSQKIAGDKVQFKLV